MKYAALVLLLALVPLTASADVVAGLRSGIELTTAPENPGPGQSTVVRASVIGDSGSSIAYRWQVGGVIVAEGVGFDRITIDAPQAGKSLSIIVSASSGGKTFGTANLVLRPAEVTLVWEGNTSRPPFYAGLPLATAASSITVLALPEFISGGSRISSSNIHFTWTENGKKMLSGYGRDRVWITPSFYNNAFIVGVTAHTADNTIVANTAFVMNPQSPELVIYEESPLAGLQDERAMVGSYSFVTDEVSFRAYPLYVTNPASISTEWTLDNTVAPTDPADPFAAVFKKTSGGSGSYTVGFSFTNAAQFLERARASFLLTF